MRPIRLKTGRAAARLGPQVGVYKNIVTVSNVVDVRFPIRSLRTSPPPLEQNHTRRDRYVQRSDGSGHRNSNQHVAVLFHQGMQSMSLAAEYQSARDRVLDGAIEFGASFV